MPYSTKIKMILFFNHLYLIYQSCPTLCDPVDCSPPGSSVHRILQARILEWVAISFSRGSSWPRDWTRVSRTGGGFFNLWATREALINTLTYMFEQHFSLYLTCLLQIQFLSELQLWYFFFQYRSMKGKFRFHPVFISNFLLNAIKLGIEFYDIYFPLVRWR